MLPNSINAPRTSVQELLKTSPGIKVNSEKPLDEIEPIPVLILGEIPDFEIFNLAFSPTLSDLR